MLIFACNRNLSFMVTTILYFDQFRSQRELSVHVSSSTEFFFVFFGVFFLGRGKMSGRLGTRLERPPSAAPFAAVIGHPQHKT